MDVKGTSVKKRRCLVLALESGIPTKSPRRLLKILIEHNVRLQDLKLSDDSIRKAVCDEYMHLVTIIVLQTTVGPFSWEVAKPCEIFKAYMESPALAPFVQVMLAKRGLDPRFPLLMVFYCDEVTPGSQLKVNNKRKTMTYYGLLLDLPAKFAHA